MSNKLSHSFYKSNNILQSAKDLLGKVLCTSINDKYTSGKIVEVEAKSESLSNLEKKIDSAINEINYKKEYLEEKYVEDMG